jgi:hypothetical protein
MNEDDHIDALFCGYTDDAEQKFETPGAGDAERDRQICAAYKNLPSNNARLRWLAGCNATEARAILTAPIAAMDGFSRGMAERRLQEISDRARVAEKAAEISARGRA